MSTIFSPSPKLCTMDQAQKAMGVLRKSCGTLRVYTRSKKWNLIQLFDDDYWDTWAAELDKLKIPQDSFDSSHGSFTEGGWVAICVPKSFRLDSVPPVPLFGRIGYKLKVKEVLKKMKKEAKLSYDEASMCLDLDQIKILLPLLEAAVKS